MAYKILPNACDGYEPIPNLEGPFSFNGRVLYYDPREGAYWDPKTDFYLSYEEFQEVSK